MNSTRTLLVTATAAGLLVGAAATAGVLTAGSASAAGASVAAGTPTPPPSQGEGTAPGGGAGPRGGHGGHGPGGLGGLRGLGQGPLLHGEFVTGGQNGQTQTVVVQTGTVTAKDGSKITVTSSDGKAIDWVLDDSTKVRTAWSQGAVKDIARGDTVTIQGTRSGDTTTAKLVAERPKAPPQQAPSAQGSSAEGT